MRILICYSMLLIIISTRAIAQTSPGSISEKDSIELLNNLMNLLDSSESPSSGLFINVGIGNRLYSIKNNALNSYQGSSKLIYALSVGYTHKNGLGLSVGANLLNEGSGTAINQFSISPSFGLVDNENIDFGISYTHYIVKNKYAPFTSPI